MPLDEKDGIGTFSVNGNNIPNLIECSFPKVDWANYTIAHSGFADKHKRKKRSWGTPGSVTGSCSYRDATLTIFETAIGTESATFIRAADGISKTFSGFITELEVEAPLEDQEMRIIFTIEIEGPVTNTP